MIEQIITSSILILAIWVLRLVFEKKISPCIKYALWLLVAVKLLVPIPDFETNLSIMNMAKNIEQSNQEMIFTDGLTVNQQDVETDNFNTTTNIEPNYSNTSINADSKENKWENGNSLSKVASVLGRMGTIVFAIIFLFSNLVFTWRIKNKRKLVAHYKELAIYEIDEPISPCLYGVLKPSIYLSKDVYDENKQVDYIILHEYTHYKHRDYLWAVIRCICIILYWYNPLVWLAANLSVKDGELACDAGVVSTIGVENRIAYGTTLVDTLKRIKKTSEMGNPLGLSTSMTGGKNDMKKRVNMIVKRPQTKVTTFVLIVILCLGLIGCTYGNAVTKDNKTAEEMYGKIVADLGDNDTYAFLVMDYEYNVMLTTDVLYDTGTEEQAAAYCDVYYYVDDEAKNLGTVMSEGTAYPVSFSKDGIYVASGHKVEKYVISEEVKLSLEKGVYETFDESGNVTYTSITDEKEVSITENEYQEMIKEYSESQIVHFSYGSDGCVNKILEAEEMLYVMGKLYKSIGVDVSKEVEKNISESEFDSPYVGTIQSVVEKGIEPNIEYQANFGVEGAEIAFYSSAIAVNIDGVWIEFVPHEKAENNTEQEKETSGELSEWITEEINIEKYDVTHDGIDDYIVTSMRYHSADIEADWTQKEKIAKQVMYDIVGVTVYEGQKNTDVFSEENALWNHEYSRVHAGNGQLSIVQIDSEEYLFTSNFYIGQEYATMDYEIFSLNKNGELNVYDEQSTEFQIGQDNWSDTYQEFYNSLNKYVENGILVIACDIDFEEQLIRTKENLYIPMNYYDNVFQKFSSLNSEKDSSTSLMGYIRQYSGTEMLFDGIEWVEVPGKRATELEVSDEDAPSGFYIYNKEDTTIEYAISKDCVYEILDWENNYQRKIITDDMFLEILKERENISIPYILMVENNEVVSITEQYIP